MKLTWAVFGQLTNIPVLHPTAYYTLNNIPEGPKLPASELSTKRTVSNVAKPAAKVTVTSSGTKAPLMLKSNRCWLKIPVRLAIRPPNAR